MQISSLPRDGPSIQGLHLSPRLDCRVLQPFCHQALKFLSPSGVITGGMSDNQSFASRARCILALGGAA